MTPTTPSPISDQAADEPIVWKLVPERPTDAMLVAAWKLWEAPGDRQFNVWRAMLAAAPTAPTTGSAPANRSLLAWAKQLPLRCASKRSVAEIEFLLNHYEITKDAAPASPAASVLSDEQRDIATFKWHAKQEDAGLTVSGRDRLIFMDGFNAAKAILAASTGGNKS